MNFNELKTQMTIERKKNPDYIIALQSLRIKRYLLGIRFWALKMTENSFLSPLLIAFKKNGASCKNL